MIQDEFTHYVRLMVDDELESQVARRFLLTVVASLDEDNGVDPKEDDVVMVYHTIGQTHCYDVPLKRHLNELEGDRLSSALEAEVDMDWDLESTMDVPSNR